MKTLNLEVEHFIFFLDQPHHLSLLCFSPLSLVEDWEKLQGIYINPGQLSLSQSKDSSFYSLSLSTQAKNWRYIICYKTSFYLEAGWICGSKNSETEMN